jgi:hypothetical protein
MSTGDDFNTSEDIKKLKVKIAGLYSSFGLPKPNEQRYQVP